MYNTTSLFPLFQFYVVHKVQIVTGSRLINQKWFHFQLLIFLARIFLAPTAAVNKAEAL